MFKALWSLFKLGLLALALALFFHNFTARFLFIWALRTELGTAVEVERAKVDLLNTRVRFEDIKIKNPEGFPREALALIPRLEIDFEVSSWRDLRFHVDDMRIECDEIRLVENADGRINFLSLKIFDPSREENSGQEGRHLALHRVDFSLNRLAYAKAGDASFPGVALNVGLRHVVFEDTGNLQALFRRIYQELVRSLSPASWNPAPSRRFWPWGGQDKGVLGKNPPAMTSQL